MKKKKLQLQNRKINKNKQVISELNNRIKSVIIQKDQQMTPPPFSDYVRSLLYHDQPITTSPLEPRKMFYKTVKYQDTLQVNALGHAFLGGSIYHLALFAKDADASCILYSNAASYDPNSKTNSLIGGWNKNVLGSSGLNVDKNEISNQYILSAHMKFSLTGVSNLNKQGQVHIFEDVNDICRYGLASDTAMNSALVNEYSLADLPKCTHYKRVDIMNMDSDTNIEFNYIPLQHLRFNWGVPPSSIASSTYTSVAINKNYGFIISSAAVGTTVRVEYEFLLAQEIANDYINNYPPIYSRIYVDPNPTLQMLQQNTINIIKTEKHDNNHYTLIKDIDKYDKNNHTNMKGVKFVTS